MHESSKRGPSEDRPPRGFFRRNARRMRALIVGTTILGIGLLISPLPGPGFTILGPLGLAILASEFAWAANLLRGFRDGTAGFRAHIDRIARRTPLWIAAAAVSLYWAGALFAALHGPFPQVVIWITASFMFPPIGYWA